MTTGRINQVTIAGRGPSRAPPSSDGATAVGVPRRSASSAGEGGPRSRTVNDTTCKASHTSHQRRGSDGLDGQSPATPEGSTHTGSTEKATHRLLASTRSDATPTAPTAGTGRGAISPPPRAAAQAHNRQASRAMPQPEQSHTRSTPAGRSAEQRQFSIFTHTHSSQALPGRSHPAPNMPHIWTVLPT